MKCAGHKSEFVSCSGCSPGAGTISVPKTREIWVNEYYSETRGHFFGGGAYLSEEDCKGNVSPVFGLEARAVRFREVIE